jgi:hypothetical protein
MGGRKNGGSNLSKKGLDLDKNVIEFINDFRQNEAYDIFQRLCNMKAREYRILTTLKVPRDGDYEDDDYDAKVKELEIGPFQANLGKKSYCLEP